jgi:hypothetical protein
MNAQTEVAEKMAEDNDKHRDPAEAQKRLRSKNLTMLAVLVGLVVLFYAVAIVRMSFD